MFRNHDFEEYYKRQEIVPAAEWDEFITALRRNLPTTFRITGNKRYPISIYSKFILVTHWISEILFSHIISLH